VVGLRYFALVRSADQWARATHEETTLDLTEGVVELAAERALPAQQPAEGPELAAGLTFDRGCRSYRSVPEEGRVERTLFTPARGLRPGAAPGRPVDLFGAAQPGVAGDFAPAAAAGGLATPRGLAIDVDDRLFVAETGARRILVFDLWSGRRLRTVATTAPGRPARAPLGLAAAGRRVWAVVTAPAGLLTLTARTGPRELPLPGALPGVPAAARPERVAVAPGSAPHLLYRDGAGDGWVVPLDDPGAAIPVPRATDLAFEPDGALVVARRAGEHMLRIRRVAGGMNTEELAARGYDGSGIALGPHGHVVFWTTRGLRSVLAARIRYARRGRVCTYRLDGGAFGIEWGRVFVDACVPAGTTLRVASATSDEDSALSGEPTVPHHPPVGVQVAIRRPDLTPPLAPTALAPGPDPLPYALHRRETGRELPWARHVAGDAFETYEAPVLAPPGRYLWVTLELAGNTSATPRVRCLRAEHPSHDLLERLPATFSRDEQVASFLRRYLALADGTLSDLEARSAERRALLDPASTPVELLDWLAGFLGLALDTRWPIPNRRCLIAEATRLFRTRGTVPGLRRFLALCLDVEPILVEHFRLRGSGAALLGGNPGAAFAGTTVGGDFRVGGAVGPPGEAPLTGTTADAFARHAHRFTVVIPAAVDPERLAAARHVLEVHRPAHTIVDVCTAGTGMRVGRGLHVALTSVIGRTGGFAPLQLGEAVLGREAIVGRPEAGTVPGSGRVGHDTRVG
jgi:phage tail-like protein